MQNPSLAADTAVQGPAAPAASRHGARFSLAPRLVACLLLAAALLKAHQLATGTSLQSRVAREWFILLVLLELAWGAWLFSEFFPRYARLASLIGFCALGGVSLARAQSGEASCGCFGSLSLSPWLTLLIDLGAFAALWWWRPRARRRIRGISLAAIILGWSVIAGFATWAMLSYQPATVSANGQIPGDEAVVLIEPRDWVGESFPLRTHMDIGEQLSDGQWVVVLFRHDCPKCEPVVDKYKSLSAQWNDNSTETQLAFVSLPPHADSNADRRAKPTSWLEGRLNETRRWVARVPLVIRLREGKVLEVSHE